MDTVIGLGSAGCNIAEEFKKYPQYSVYKIDTDLKGENCYGIIKQSNPEDYERNCPNMAAFFSDTSDDILFILAGGGKISGASLAILKHLKDKNINLLYIKPQKSDLSKQAALQDKVVFNVLQEYTRSGIFKKMYIASNAQLEELIGEVPILQHNKKINEFIASTIHYINIFNNTDPLIDNTELPSEVSRIGTFGTRNLLENSENYFYNLVEERNKIYYFAYPEEVLNTDTKLLKNIKEAVSENDLRASYQIHATKHVQPFCYFVSFSNVIQPVDN